MEEQLNEAITETVVNHVAPKIQAVEINGEVLRVVGTESDLAKAVEKFDSSFRDRSFSGRHPELGKMIKCDCGHRHRSSIIHERVFATDIKGEPCAPRVAPAPRVLRTPANPYGWRPKPNPLLMLLVHKFRLTKLQAQQQS